MRVNESLTNKVRARMPTSPCSGSASSSDQQGTSPPFPDKSTYPRAPIHPPQHHHVQRCPHAPDRVQVGPPQGEGDAGRPHGGHGGSRGRRPDRGHDQPAQSRLHHQEAMVPGRFRGSRRGRERRRWCRRCRSVPAASNAALIPPAQAFTVQKVGKALKRVQHKSDKMTKKHHVLTADRRCVRAPPTRAPRPPHRSACFAQCTT